MWEGMRGHKGKARRYTLGSRSKNLCDHDAWVSAGLAIALVDSGCFQAPPGAVATDIQSDTTLRLVDLRGNQN